MMDGVCVALLRGVNVGGKNILPMKALAEIFVAAECSGVKTYIQSGNVVFHTTKIESIASSVRDQIEEQFNLKIPVILRTSAELQKAIAANPFLKRGVSEALLHVMFLEHKPTPRQVLSLDANRSTPDEFIVLGKEIYVHLPNGGAKTKLTNAYFDSKLETIGTQRNWRTILALAGMMQTPSRPDEERPLRGGSRSGLSKKGRVSPENCD